MIRNGIDLVEINRFESLNPRIMGRFIQRVFTPLEIEICAGRFDRLAGRFAAKEAVAKTLGTGLRGFAWQDIEIGQGQQGEPELRLHGEAKQIAIDLGIQNWSISISHGKELAIAMVIGYS